MNELTINITLAAMILVNAITLTLGLYYFTLEVFGEKIDSRFRGINPSKIGIRETLNMISLKREL